MRLAPEKFTLPRLIMCEGPEDVYFFRRLIEARQLTNWHIRHTGVNRHERGGCHKFAETLRALKTGRSGFKEVIRVVAIVRDSDDDLGAAFQSIQTQLAFADMPVPQQAHALTDGQPAVGVLMMPMDGEGNLECVCGESTRRIDPIRAAFVDQFVDQVGGNDWPAHQRGKLWLRTMIAARWQRDSFVNLGPLLKAQGNQNPTVIPLIDHSFNPIANLLEQWAAH